MPKETKEQRAERLAREQEAAELALAEYTKSVPARLAAAENLARKLGISTKITLTEGGPSVHFYDDQSEFDHFLTYQVERWELEWIEEKLSKLKQEQDDKLARRQLAEDVWVNKLSSEERFAIKENIYSLKTK